MDSPNLYKYKRSTKVNVQKAAIENKNFEDRVKEENMQEII